MLTNPMTYVLPRSFFRSQQQSRRDWLLARKLALYVLGGALLASMLLTAHAIHTGGTSSSHDDEIAALEDDVATDGRAALHADDDEIIHSELAPVVVVSRLSPDCAAHARDKLLAGLAHYYLQRSLRPNATSEDAAEISAGTAILAGPGDPAATPAPFSCAG